MFGRLLELSRFCGVLTDCDGTEPDFPQRAAQAIPSVPLPDWETLLLHTAAAAYGRENPTPAADAFAREVYQKAARSLFPQLPWYRKLLFRYWKFFL